MSALIGQIPVVGDITNQLFSLLDNGRVNPNNVDGIPDGMGGQKNMIKEMKRKGTGTVKNSMKDTLLSE